MDKVTHILVSLLMQHEIDGELIRLSSRFEPLLHLSSRYSSSHYTFRSAAVWSLAVPLVAKVVASQDDRFCIMFVRC